MSYKYFICLRRVSTSLDQTGSDRIFDLRMRKSLNLEMQDGPNRSEEKLKYFNFSSDLLESSWIQ